MYILRDLNNPMFIVGQRRDLCTEECTKFVSYAIERARFVHVHICRQPGLGRLL